VKPTLERRWRPETEGPEKATERSLSQSCIHVAALDWRSPEVVT
jgi:hypothetical protein